jgi:hypothetical protein
LCVRRLFVPSFRDGADLGHLRWRVCPVGKSDWVNANGIVTTVQIADRARGLKPAPETGSNCRSQNTAGVGDRH